MGRKKKKDTAIINITVVDNKDKSKILSEEEVEIPITIYNKLAKKAKEENKSIEKFIKEILTKGIKLLKRKGK